MTKDIEREAFKLEMMDDYNMREVDTPFGKSFVMSSTNQAFKVWTIAKRHEAKKLEGCVVSPTTPSYEMWSGIARDLGRYMQMHDRYCPKTLKKYFDRFIGDIPEWLNKEVKDWNSDHAFATADLPAFIYMSMLEAARGGNE